MKIKVLGTGCAKCDELAKNVREAADRLGIAADLEKVTDVTEIVRCGVMRTPALMLGNRIVSVGRTLSVDEAAALLEREAGK